MNITGTDNKGNGDESSRHKHDHADKHCYFIFADISRSNKMR